MALNEIPKERWDRLRGELIAYREAEAARWGGIDDVLLARYIAGECSLEESERVNRVSAECSAVKEAISIAAEALLDVPIDSIEASDNSKETAEISHALMDVELKLPQNTHGARRAGRASPRSRRGFRTLLEVSVVAGLFAVIFIQRIEILRLSEKSEEGSRLVPTTAGNGGSISWTALLREHYDRKLSAEENLDLLERIGGQSVREKIRDLRRRNSHATAEEVVNLLFREWGGPTESQADP